eukprot:scaffold52871_cov105-Phaeocystis_antarctica.AAC.1
MSHSTTSLHEKKIEYSYSADCEVSLAQLEHALHTKAAAHAQRGCHAREEEQRAVGLGRPRDGACPCACCGGVARVEQRRASLALAKLGSSALAAQSQEQLAREAAVESPQLCHVRVHRTKRVGLP